MSYREAEFDAMLRCLGAAYPQTIHGEATASDVARALESAKEADGHAHEEPHRRPHRGRWRVITIHPDAPLGAAARLMNGHRIRRLPVFHHSGQLLGIVSRRDLLSIFLRPDEEIAAKIHSALTGILLEEPCGVVVTVREGVVTLSGALSRKGLIRVAERLAAGVDGVVGVTCELTQEA